MNKLMEKMLASSTIKDSNVLKTSKFFNNKDVISTSVPMINVALSGKIDGGLTPGVTTLAGPSKHFKTGFSLLLASAYIQKYKDSVLIFYDSEFGTPHAYFNTFGIPLDRVIHTPVSDIEELKHDIVTQLTNITDKDKVFIIVDSVGNLSSRKEELDALEGKVVADMTRAKSLKGFFRTVTSKLTRTNVPMVVIQHTYQTMEMFSRTVLGGGTGNYYGSDNIWILGRQQDKDKDKDVVGYNFIINVEKSRYVKEKSKIPITISWESGINKWSGLFDVALEGGYIISTKKGYYAAVDKNTGEIIEPAYKTADIIVNGDFWTNILQNTDFPKYIEATYKIPEGQLLESVDTEQ